MVLNPKEPIPPAGLAVRLCALRLLGAIIDKKTSLDALTDNEHGHPHYLALDGRDRALLRAILVCALRHRGVIDAILAGLIDHPLPHHAHALRHLLHITAAQILYLHVADYAAINLAVIIARKDPRLKRFSKLVNAVGRNISRQRAHILACPQMSPPWPQWFADLLASAYPADKVTAMATALTHEPYLDITVKSDPEGWAKTLSAHLLPNGSLRLDKMHQPVQSLPGFARGAWWVQDVAASLPVALLGPIKGKRVADLCAAPGGKTAQLAHLGAHVTAIDISKNRLKRLEANMERLNLLVETRACDLKTYHPAQKFDAVLLDAPCSATGTIRRHPDILWTKSLQDIEKMSALQEELLNHALRLTKVGGVIVFANCSLAPQEGEELIPRFLQHHSGVRLSPIRPDEMPAAFASLVTQQGFLRTTSADLCHENPSLSGMDGFFVARLIKMG